jgi:hypothetical protein
MWSKGLKPKGSFSRWLDESVSMKTMTSPKRITLRNQQTIEY